MTQDYRHPATPPPELVQQWLEEADTYRYLVKQVHQYIATRAAQRGADQELEACVKWLNSYMPGKTGDQLLRPFRRPKPPSLKEQALALLDKAEDPSWDINDFSIVRQALEQLND